MYVGSDAVYLVYLYVKDTASSGFVTHYVVRMDDCSSEVMTRKIASWAMNGAYILLNQYCLTLQYIPDV